jgi:hypothetical protein
MMLRARYFRIRGKNWGVMLALAAALWIAAPAPGALAQDRIAVGAQIGGESLPELGETPLSYGLRFTYGFYMPFIAFDSEVNWFPTHASGNFGQSQAFFGLKAGARVSKFGLFLKARPGWDQFSGGADSQRLTRRTNFAMDFGGGVEYYFAPHLALRWDLSDVMTHFGGGVVLRGPGSSIGTTLGTQHNFESTVGLLVHF